MIEGLPSPVAAVLVALLTAWQSWCTKKGIETASKLAVAAVGKVGEEQSKKTSVTCECRVTFDSGLVGLLVSGAATFVAAGFWLGRCSRGVTLTAASAKPKKVVKHETSSDSEDSAVRRARARLASFSKGK